MHVGLFFFYATYFIDRILVFAIARLIDLLIHVVNVVATLLIHDASHEPHRTLALHCSWRGEGKWHHACNVG